MNEKIDNIENVACNIKIIFELERNEPATRKVIKSMEKLGFKIAYDISGGNNEFVAIYPEENEC